MRFIHIADVHIGMTPDINKAWSKARAMEIVDTFHRLIEVCNKDHIELLLIAGDLFHRQPLLRELKEVNYAFSKLIYTKVVLIAGNHDYISSRSHYNGFSWNENVTMLGSDQMEDVYFSKINTKVYGFSYHTQNIYEARLNERKSKDETCINILLAHGGEEKNIPINMKYLSQGGYDYVALGHIHKPQRIMERIAYSGSLEPLDKNEIGNHGYMLGEIDEKTKELTLNFQPFALRNYYHLQYEVKPYFTQREIKDNLVGEISKIGENHIYKIILTGLHDGDIEIQPEDFVSIGNIVEVVNETIPDYDFEVLQYENKDNMIGMFIDTIRHKGEEDDIADKALYYGTHALIQKDN